MAGWREELPASLAEILQNGLLDHVFGDALVGAFIYDQLADVRPWQGQVGSTSIMTRSGLLTPSFTSVTGSDATTQTYGFEQYQVQMNQYGFSIDTNMAMSAMALASKFLQDAKTLAIGAAQSLDQLAQNQLYSTFGGGQTFCTTGSTGTQVNVQDITGFSQTIVSVAGTGAGASEGLSIESINQATGVSGTYPGYVSLNGGSGVAYTSVTASGAAVTQNGQVIQPGYLTLSSAAATGSAVEYNSVIAVAGTTGALSNPVNSYISRAGGVASQSALTSSDTATLALFRTAVTRLKSMHVPQRRGAYTAYVHPETVAELFADTEFQSAYRGRGEDEVYREGVLGLNADATYLGRLAGIDWIENTYTPTVAFGGGASGNTVYRPIVCGDDVLIKAPFEDMATLLDNMTTGATVHVTEKNGVVYILRAPLDRFGQVLSQTWSWIGGYTNSTDVLTGDQSIYKRAVVIEHS